MINAKTYLPTVVLVNFIFISLILTINVACNSVKHDSVEVSFLNTQDGIRLSGTLTIPKQEKTFPAVLLVQGSGPHNRDEEILGHKPFKVIADYLSNNGIAVLRVDRRGVGKSEGRYLSLDLDHFVEDALSGIKFLKSYPNVDNDKIGIIGHSLGGLIAPMASSRTDDIDFIVSLAGPGIWGKNILYSQNRLWAELSGANSKDIEEIKKLAFRQYELITKDSATAADFNEFRKIYVQLSEYLSSDLRNMFFQKPADKAYSDFREPQFRKAFQIDPLSVWDSVHCPVLVINGSKDYQVQADVNLDEIRKGLIKGGNEQYKIVKLENHNHLFQRTNNGSPEEYGKIKESFSPVALNLILNWINSI